MIPSIKNNAVLTWVESFLTYVKLYPDHPIFCKGNNHSSNRVQSGKIRGYPPSWIQCYCHRDHGQARTSMSLGNSLL